LANFLASHAGPQAQRERRVGQLRHSVTNGSGILRSIWIEPAEPAEVENAVWRDRQFELHLSRTRPLGRAERVFVRPCVRVVRTVFLGRKKRACFRKAIPQIRDGEQSAEDGALGVPTTSRVKFIAAF
jgi:hypothetical protein